MQDICMFDSVFRNTSGFGLMAAVWQLVCNQKMVSWNIQKFGVWIIYLFYVFERSLFCANIRLHLFDQNTVKTIQLWHGIITIQNNLFLFEYMFKCTKAVFFSIITPVVSVTQSSEIIIIYWFTAQETFLIIINVENSCAAFSFSGNCHRFLFSGLFDE